MFDHQRNGPKKKKKIFSLQSLLGWEENVREPTNK
jgi:hypothetical protein